MWVRPAFFRPTVLGGDGLGHTTQRVHVASPETTNRSPVRISNLDIESNRFPSYSRILECLPSPPWLTAHGGNAYSIPWSRLRRQVLLGLGARSYTTTKYGVLPRSTGSGGGVNGT